MQNGFSKTVISKQTFPEEKNRFQSEPCSFEVVTQFVINEQNMYVTTKVNYNLHSVTSSVETGGTLWSKTQLSISSA